MASRVSSRISASVTSDTELRICCCSLSARAMGTACGRAGVLGSALIHTKTGAHREDVAQHAGDRFGSPITRRPDAAALSDGADSPPVSIPVLRMPPRKPQMTRRMRWARSIVSICNSYRANLPLRVADRDKRSARFTNISICNSCGAKPAPDVTDRDKRADHQPRQATKRTGRPAITTGTSGPVKHQLGKLNQQIAASTLRPGP